MREGLGWLGLGAAIVVGSVRMDRLAGQGVSPFAAPGLLPGLLGIAMVLCGSLLALRARTAAGPAEWQPGRMAAVMVLCLGFGLGLVGHGLPFFLASWLFVSVSILVLRRPAPLTARAALFAVLTGGAAGAGVTLVFEHLFLVRLP